MIKYHGTPIGGSGVSVAEFLTGRHALVSYNRPDDMAVVAAVCQSFILDNGAYSIWKQGGGMDYEGYLQFVETWAKHPGFDWAIIPDVIEGTEEQNDVFLERWPKHLKGVPVYHMNEGIDRLKRLTAEYEIVAIGSAGHWPTPNAIKWWVRIGEIMDAICDEEGRPPCKLHGLKMLNPEVYKRLPLSSADSVNAGRNNNIIKGPYPGPTGW